LTDYTNNNITAGFQTDEINDSFDNRLSLVCRYIVFESWRASRIIARMVIIPVYWGIISSY